MRAVLGQDAPQTAEGACLRLGHQATSEHPPGPGQTLVQPSPTEMPRLSCRLLCLPWLGTIGASTGGSQDRVPQRSSSSMPHGQKQPEAAAVAPPGPSCELGAQTTWQRCDHTAVLETSSPRGQIRKRSEATGPRGFPGGALLPRW